MQKTWCEKLSHLFSMTIIIWTDIRKCISLLFILMKFIEVSFGQNYDSNIVPILNYYCLKFVYLCHVKLCSCTLTSLILKMKHVTIRLYYKRCLWVLELSLPKSKFSNCCSITIALGICLNGKKNEQYVVKLY